MDVWVVVGIARDIDSTKSDKTIMKDIKHLLCYLPLLACTGHMGIAGIVQEGWDVRFPWK